MGEDNDDEPEMACKNCADWQGVGHRICVNTRSTFMRERTSAWMACSLFFPDPKRWPDADHD